MDRRRDWPRAVMALLVVGSSAAIGVTTVLAGPAGAQAATCGQVVTGVLGPCAPPGGGTASLAPSNTGGPAAIKTKWTGVAQGGHIGSVKVTVAWVSAGTPAGAPTLDPAPVSFTAACPPAGYPQSCDVGWPDALLANGYVLNGQYSLTTTASTCPDVNDNQLLSCSDYKGFDNTSGIFAVKNPPSPPANVTAKLVTAPVPGVALTWDPSPEPDVFAYEVIRLSGSQQAVVYGCAQIWAPKEFAGLARCDAKLTWTDTASGGGKFSYQVKATRFGQSYSYADKVLSAAAQTNAAVTVPGPPGPTVGTGKPTAGFGGLGAIFGPVKPRSGVVAPIFGKLGPNPNAPGTTDAGFNPTLPYNPAPAVTDPPSTVALAAPAAPEGHSSVASIALIGAGVLVVVVALHGLWLRGEVKRSGALEALEPEL